MSLLTDLDAFYMEHRRCGDLDAGHDGAVAWLTCRCGATMARRLPDAALEPRPGACL
jgi:hypothetical protein